MKSIILYIFNLAVIAMLVIFGDYQSPIGTLKLVLGCVALVIGATALIVAVRRSRNGA